MLAIGDRLQTVGGCLEQRTTMAVRGAAVRSFDALVFCDSELHKSTAEELVAVVGVFLFVGLPPVFPPDEAPPPSSPFLHFI